MARKLFVHVGPAKTGTSAVQHILRAHDNSVVLYPGVGLWADGAHHNLVLNFYGDFARPDVTKCHVDKLLAELAKAVQISDRDVVISSEILAGRKNIESFIQALIPVVGCSPADVKILFTCRDHFGRAASLYNQRVKDGVTRETRGPDEFLKSVSGSLCYEPVIRRLCDTGFKVKVMNYHPAKTFVKRFLRRVGFLQSAIPPPETHNVSLSTKGLIAMLAANRIARDNEERTRFFEALKEMHGMFAPSKFIFGREAAVVADRRFAPDRRFVQSEYGKTLPEPNLANSESAFFITPEEFDEIAYVTQKLSGKGEAILGAARDYLRTD